MQTITKDKTLLNFVLEHNLSKWLGIESRYQGLAYDLSSAFSSEEINNQLESVLTIINKEQFFLMLDFNSYDTETTAKKEILIKLINNGLNIDEAISKIDTYNIADIATNTLYELREFIFSHQSKPLSINNFLRMSVGCPDDLQKKFVEYALENAADINSAYYNTITILESFFQRGNLDIIQTFGLNKNDISTATWVLFIMFNPNIHKISEAIELFPTSFSHEEIKNLMRSHGMSISYVELILTFYNLAEDYLNGNLSEYEQNILKSPQTEFKHEDYETITLNNTYGLNPLHLALLSSRLALAINLLENEEYNFNQLSNNGISPIRLVLMVGAADPHIYPRENLYEDKQKLFSLIDKKLEDVDQPLNENYETILDYLYILPEELRNSTLIKSHDPLVDLIKPEAKLSLPEDTINIAISQADGFWSTGAWAFSRMAKTHNPQANFYLVTPKIYKKGGIDFVKQFDGWINPGGDDDYPRHLQEFSINDWTSQSELIHMYQEVLTQNKELKTPTMGMCAGAQNFVLNNNGYLKPVTDYILSQHSIIYFKHTLSHFMTMSSEQQKLALNHCHFPEIIFKGDTAHNFAGVTYKLGDQIELGAISEDGVAMSYAHKNGLFYATQFHPEHHYTLLYENNINHEKEWWDNFIKLATLNNAHKKGFAPHPEEVMSFISERLSQCNSAPTCVEDNEIFTNTTGNILVEKFWLSFQ